MIAQHNQKSQRNIPKGSNRVAMKKIGDKTVLSIPLILLVPGAGIEPAQPQVPRDFKTKTDERRVASQPPVFLFKYLLRLNKLKNS